MSRSKFGQINPHTEPEVEKRLKGVEEFLEDERFSEPISSMNVDLSSANVISVFSSDRFRNIIY